MGEIQEFTAIARKIVQNEQEENKTPGFSSIFKFPYKDDYKEWMISRLKIHPTEGRRWLGLYWDIINSQIEPSGMTMPLDWKSKLITAKTNCVFIISNEEDQVINIGKSEFPAMVAILDKFIPKYSDQYPNGQKMNYTPEIWDEIISKGKHVQCFFCYDLTFDPEILEYCLLYEYRNKFGHLPIYNKRIPNNKFLPKVIETRQLILELLTETPVHVELPKMDQELNKIRIRSESPVEVKKQDLKMQEECDPLSTLRSPIVTLIDIPEGKRGISYEKLFLPYLKGVRSIKIYDPWIRMYHQFINLLSFCKIIVPSEGTVKVELITKSDPFQEPEIIANLHELKNGISRYHIEFDFIFEDYIHDRWIETDTGWRIIIGRGLDIFYQSYGPYTPDSHDQLKRKCKGTTIIYTRQKKE